MKPIIILLVLLFLYLQYRLWLGDGNLPDVIQLGNQVEAQREENIRLRERNDVLDAEVRGLRCGQPGDPGSTRGARPGHGSTGPRDSARAPELFTQRELGRK